ncbi:MAG: flagellar assembly protein FliW [Oscillospiraceae bacterium]|nr:flagellar assembly protein FliW [Oscillospiraceae bacterium]
MIKINTRDFGEIEVNEDDIFTFPTGVFAFEETRHFALFSPLGEDVYPKWLQSTDAITPCFIVFDPTIIAEDYATSLNPAEETLLKIKDGSEVRLLVIATVPEDYKKTTVNMKSPIIINVKEKLAAQVILPNNYEFRLPIYVEAGEKAGAD